ncbi:MAG: patatin-like phospholipase family protein [Deltaproteobacteria bacterium]|jgi:patatin-like phospholipase/acyl hydrolase|nr:patatin-like phospholipase family protein [Deltaproteobacteria bacterium]
MKHVLSIDGGGIRGIIPALVLAEIEKRTGKKTAELFDIVAGTSTGGILALGLTKDNGSGVPEFSAGDLAKLYEKRGKDIFSRSLWKGVSSVGGYVDEKYAEEGLERVLVEYFGNEPLGAALTKVLITSYDIHNRHPYFFKSWRTEWQAVEMRLVARATSAAPTYFEPALIPVSGSMKALIDGGVFINNPAVSAYAELKRLFPDENEYIVVSIGTGELVRPISYSEAKDWGKAGWMLPVLSCMFDGVCDAADYQLKQILRNSYFRLQTSLSTASDDLDDATNGNIANLKSEAKKLIRTNKDTIGRICDTLMQSHT